MGQNGNMIQLQKLMFSKNRIRCPFNMSDLASYIDKGFDYTDYLVETKINKFSKIQKKDNVLN